jgi:hypothetical protein
MRKYTNKKNTEFCTGITRVLKDYTDFGLPFIGVILIYNLSKVPGLYRNG